ncbi:MAG TPA: preprotein translocase subunit SecE [Clostridiaceae bacterium]|jgi:preprotein translocase subunit SecE|nr:preprotein translocase subunit SecE [Clostridiaceae bacterium]
MGAGAKVNESKSTNKLAKFFKDTKAELKKVTWPSKDEIKSSTGIAIGYMLLFTLVIWAYDSVFHVILKNVVG